MDGSPAMLDHEAVATMLDGQDLAVFLDYDGTLTPIVARPELALLPPATLEVLERLAGLCPVGIISGRDLDDLRPMVDCDRLWMAGSHGFDIEAPDGARYDYRGADDLRPLLDRAVEQLDVELGEVPGAWIEPKRFALAVHHRQSPDELVPRLEEMVSAVAAGLPGLVVVPGKKIFELRPDIEWNKGTALHAVLDAVTTDGASLLPVYIGDDTTDEDAFRAIVDQGLGVLVDPGRGPTAARHRLSDPDEVRGFLVWLADQLEERSDR